MTIHPTPLPNSLKKVILTRVKPGAKLILGISGGPDSVALLHLLLEAGFRPILAHVNYHLRGKDSQADQKLVEKLALEYQLELERLETYPAKLKGNLETNCRKIRYEFFEKARRQHRAAAILVAHTQDDQAETFLLNLTRGARLRGLQAMPEWDNERHLLRPLLQVSKKELLTYLKKNRHTFRLDKSNTDLKFSRNFIRHKIVPLFQKLNPSFTKTLSSTIENLTANLEVVEAQTNQWLKENFCQNSFPLNALLALPDGLQRQIISRLYQDYNDSYITTPTLQEILRTLRQNRAGLRKEFGPKHFLNITKNPSNHRVICIVRIKTHKF